MIRPLVEKPCQRVRMLFQHGNNSVFYNVDMFQYLQLFQCCTAMRIFRTVIKTVVIRGRKGDCQAGFSWRRSVFVALRKILPARQASVAARHASAAAFLPANKICVIVTPFSSSFARGQAGDKQGTDLARMDWFWRWTPVSQGEASTSAPIRCDR